jgi:hypothetical protein
MIAGSDSQTTVLHHVALILLYMNVGYLWTGSTYATKQTDPYYYSHLVSLACWGADPVGITEMLHMKQSYICNQKHGMHARLISGVPCTYLIVFWKCHPSHDLQS